jgi:hypothetical protein
VVLCTFANHDNAAGRNCQEVLQEFLGALKRIAFCKNFTPLMQFFTARFLLRQHKKTEYRAKKLYGFLGFILLY